MTLWPYRAELRRLLTPTFLITAAAGLLVEVAMTVSATRQNEIRSSGHAAIASAGTIAGALRVSALQNASLVGLALTTALAVALVCADFEAGVLSALLLAEPRRIVLMARKLATAAATLLGFTLAGAVTVLVSARIAQTRYGEIRLGASTPDWHLVSATMAKALLVQFFFLAVTMGAAVLLRGAVATAAAVMGGAIALAPLCRVPVAASWVPHYWVSAWLGLSPEDQFQAYFWNSSSSTASVTWCFTAIATSTATALAALLLSIRREGFLSASDRTG